MLCVENWRYALLLFAESFARKFLQIASLETLWFRTMQSDKNKVLIKEKMTEEKALYTKMQFFPLFFMSYYNIQVIFTSKYSTFFPA